MLQNAMRMAAARELASLTNVNERVFNPARGDGYP